MKLAITGVGIVSPLGNDIHSVTQNLKALEVPVTDYQLPGHFADTFLEIPKAFHCDIENLETEHVIKPKDKRWMDPTVTTSMVAVDQAVQMSGKQFPSNTPVFVGTIRGGAPNLATFLHKCERRHKTITQLM